MVSGTIADYCALSNADAVNVGIDMGNRSWSMAAHFYRTGKVKQYTFKGRTCADDCVAAIKAIADAGHAVHVTYEVGRDGFLPARRLREECGAQVTVLPVNRLEVVCQGKKVKTDRIDAVFLAGLDARAMPKLPAVWTPPEETEARRRALRERQRLTTNIGRLNNQLISILKRWPVASIDNHQAAAKWEELLLAEDQPLRAVPKLEQLGMANMVEELALLEEHLAKWDDTLREEEQHQREEAAQLGQATVLDILRQYRGVGTEISRHFDWYLGDPGRFKRGGSLASYLGLTPTPYCSGTMNREQGISKQGNKELRRKMIQLAWLWRQWQPDSALARKWEPRLARRGRERKTAIVALARQLCVAFYRLLVHGEPIEGAVMNAPLPASLLPQPHSGGAASTSRRTLSNVSTS